MKISDEQFFKKLPKIELHAHLNGSLSESTLLKLQHHHISLGRLEKNYPIGKYFSKDNTLAECFALFPIAQSLTVDKESVYTATSETIKEFSDDGCIYLELRSTPRATEHMTKSEYIEAMVEAIRDSTHINITVKLIISIDRRMEVQSAKETVDLILKYSRLHKDVIVGVDLSGDPTKGDFSNFLECLCTVRQNGLKVTIHCAEVSNTDEVSDILNFKPDRLGHAVCIHKDLGGSDEVWTKFLDSRIPVEICLTSNIKTKSHPSYEEHHVKLLHQHKHPYVISTDDKGLFSTELSTEHRHLAKILSLTRNDIVNLVISSCQHIFGTEAEINILVKIVKDFAENNDV